MPSGRPSVSMRNVNVIGMAFTPGSANPVTGKERSAERGAAVTPAQSTRPGTYSNSLASGGLGAEGAEMVRSCAAAAGAIAQQAAATRTRCGFMHVTLPQLDDKLKTTSQPFQFFGRTTILYGR